MGKPVTAAFISNLVCIPTEQVDCLQVTQNLQEFLDEYPPKSREKAFKSMYHILQLLDEYLIDNPKQHRYCMSPDNEYVILIVYAFTLGIDMCNFLAIWAVLYILLDTVGSQLPYVQTLQHVYNTYYQTSTQEVMERLEQQVIEYKRSCIIA